MGRGFAVVIAAAVVSSTGHAQSTQAAPSVLFDVVVQDTDGHTAHGLTLRDFRLTEEGVLQTLSRVEEHAPESAPAAPPSVPLPAGTFTDYTPIASDTALNILLIDALNTPTSDRAFIRNQLQEYVKRANPNTRIAVFGLANHLVLLQGFTSDPAVLRDVVERKLIARATSPSVHPSDQRPASNGGPSAIEIAANLREFEAGLGGMETGLSAHYTLDAFNTLAHYLAGFPGRKNLIWVSGSFPLKLLPGATEAVPPDVNLDDAELRETVTLLSNARVSVYPIDARGLIGQPPSKAIHGKHAQTEAAEYAAIDELAAGTGGRAFHNGNDLADAVASAVGAGSDFYTLRYTSTDTKEDGSYRPIRVDTNGLGIAQHLRLFYRRGYYANDAAADAKPSQPPDLSARTPEEGRAAAYKQAAMSRGAPMPEDIVFKVRVLPSSTSTETSVAAGNEVSSGVSAKGPFRRYDLDYLFLPGELTFTEQTDGQSTAKVEFLAYVFDTEGRLLDATGKTVSLEAATTSLAKLMHNPLRCHLEVSVPDRAETFLRIGIRDVPANKFGVIEVPTSSVSFLPAAAYTPAPATGLPTPPKD